MEAHKLEITGRNKATWAAVADAADFDFQAIGAIDAQFLLTNPRVSLYCLDPVTRRA